MPEINEIPEMGLPQIPEIISGKEISGISGKWISGVSGISGISSFYISGASWRAVLQVGGLFCELAGCFASWPKSQRFPVFPAFPVNFDLPEIIFWYFREIPKTAISGKPKVVQQNIRIV